MIKFKVLPSGRSLQIDSQLIPKDTILHKISSKDSLIPSRQDNDHFIISYDYEDLDNLFRYLETGQVKNTESLVKTLDYFELNPIIKCSYPEDFLRIKLSEDWYRNNLYQPFFFQSSHSRGSLWTNSINT